MKSSSFGLGDFAVFVTSHQPVCDKLVHCQSPKKLLKKVVLSSPHKRNLFDRHGQRGNVHQCGKRKQSVDLMTWLISMLNIYMSSLFIMPTLLQMVKRLSVECLGDEHCLEPECKCLHLRHLVCAWSNLRQIRCCFSAPTRVMQPEPAKGKAHLDKHT